MHFESKQADFGFLLGTMVLRLKVVRDIVLTCVVLHNMIRAHKGRVATVSIPADDVAAIANESGYVSV